MQAQADFAGTEEATRRSLLEERAQPEIRVRPPPNPHVQYPAEKVKEFIFSREGFKAIATPLFQIGLFYLSPGVGARLTGNLTSLPGLLNNFRAVASYSTQYWYGFFTPEMSVFGLTMWGVKAYASVKLFNSLCVGPVARNYAAWRIARMQTFYDNLMIPEQFHNDAVLKENICGITLFPIRYPVKDRYGRYWEQGAISAWLIHSKTCPLTRQPLEEIDLVFDEELYQKISRKLEALQNAQNQV